MALVAGCAQQGGAPAATATAPPAGEVARFNGWYEGRGTRVGPAMNCREQTRSIWFRVENGLVEMRPSRHRRTAVAAPILTGTLSPDGQVALRGTSSQGLTAGQIAGGRVTVEDASPVAVRDWRNACRYRYEAEFREALRN